MAPFPWPGLTGPQKGGLRRASLPQPSRPCPAAARTFSPSTTSNSTVSPSPTLRKNFLGLFLLMAVWQGKGQEKGEGSKPGVSLTPVGSAAPISFCSPSVVPVAPEGGARPQAKFSGGEAAKQTPAGACALGLSPVPRTLSLRPLPLRDSQGEAASSPKSRGALRRLCGAGLRAPAPGAAASPARLARGPGPPQPHCLRGSGAGPEWAGDANAAGTRTRHPRVSSPRPLSQNTA